MKEKIKPLVQSYVRFMESCTPPPGSFFIPMVGLICASAFNPQQECPLQPCCDRSFQLR